MMKKFWKRHAITLVELLIAITLLTIISAICYGTLHSAFSFWEKENLEQETLRRGQIVLSRMANDLRCAYIRRPSQKKYFRGKVDSVHFIQIDAKELVEVGYFLRQGKLFRRYCEAYGEVDAPPGKETDMLKDVDGLVFRYVAEGGENLETWPHSQFRAETESTLPKAIKITLVLKIPQNQKKLELPEVIVQLPLGGKDHAQTQK